MTSILITGGSGAFGQAFVRHLVTDNLYNRIVVYSRGEFRQFEMAQGYSPEERERLRFFIGDVRDRDRLRRAMNGIEHVVHAAALKRIEVGHYNPVEVFKTNVLGAVNVIEAAQDARVKKVVGLSTDKAFEPVSPYGTSKAMAESLFLASNNTSGKDGPRFSICRYGNVWNSTGSVVPTWKKLIAEGHKTVPVTSPECTRFYMKMDEAITLVLDTLKTMKGGEVNIPTLPAYKLGDLAKAMEVNMNVIGLPDYEKLFESMAKGVSSDKARRMTVEELRAALMPPKGRST